VSILGFSTLALATLVSCRSTPKQPDVATTLKPLNVVLITLDTVRADHLHCYGYDKIQTPNIDALAASGALFEKAVAQTPLTQPSHASMFTGTNPNVHNVRDTGGFALQSSSVTLATILQKRGWDTAGFISASVLKKLFGFSQGFSFYDDAMPQTKTGQDVATRPANVTVDHALTWLNGQSGKPIFLWVHLYDAHVPYDPPAQFRKEYPQNQYDAEIAFEDQQLGRFLDGLKQKSPPGKTLIVLLADHGEGLGDHGEFEHGVFLYDSTVRIAWIMAGPGVPAGTRVRQQAREIDMLPTILDLMGGRASAAVQGTSLVPAFTGKTVPSTYSYEETLYPQINMGWAALRGIHTADWMYVRAPKPELYDLNKDPGELNNVIDAHPKEYRELEAQLKKMSRLGSDGKEKVVVNQMDTTTTAQLKSLGYVAGFSDRNIEVDGKGPDAKDHLNTLKVLQIVGHGPDADAMPIAHKIGLLEQALQNDPLNPTLNYSLIQAYQQAGQYQQALQACLNTMQHGIHDGMILSQTANLYLRLGNIKEAISYYEKAAQLNPLDVEGQSDLATAYVQVGRIADAERVYKWVLAIQPYAPAYNGLGIIAVKSQDYAGARKNFEHAIQLDPNYVEGQLNLGIVCAQTHDFPCARKAFKVFVANAPPSYGKVILQAKSALVQMGSGRS
jgi:arylsulfatase A-like enzyme/Tfp pilus assembly protein PilF